MRTREIGRKPKVFYSIVLHARRAAEETKGRLLDFNPMIPVNYSIVLHARTHGDKYFGIESVNQRLGLPLIPPYFGIKESGSVVAFRQGVNYAVAGSTAIDSSFVEAKASGSVVINGSLGVQLSWFKQSLPSICGNTSGTIGVFIVFRCVFHALEILKTGITLFYLANCRIIEKADFLLLVAH
ncbi:putative sinapine esterase [Helianthus annuus]|uniref:Sinapine esterase n=1 Tax=Helianthus annuus TaxID=4232 RepID=A0A9K3GZQ8_HELAN|nr:putative sinapine esterase [Helianthus annuus]